MPELMSMRAYAATRKERGLSGGSLAAVQKAVASKRIRLIDGKIDPSVADFQWSKNTEPTSAAATAGVPAAVTNPPGPDYDDSDPVSFTEAKLRTEKVRAQLLETELAEKHGTLTSVEAVRNQTFEKARIARDAIMAIPSRLAAQLAAESDESTVRILLTVELRRVCNELAAGEAGTRN